MEADANRAVILFSHGSLLCGSGQSLEAQAARLRQVLSDREGTPPQVEIGYLNYSEPLFASAFQRCVLGGASQITVVPYFLVAGYFVNVDLPRALADVRRQYPEIEIQVGEAMRDHPALVAAVLSSAQRGLPPATWRRHSRIASQFCRSNPECPLHGTESCPATTVTVRKQDSLRSPCDAARAQTVGR
jgi:sirohydrochlorin cobaltochelatase